MHMTDKLAWHSCDFEFDRQFGKSEWMQGFTEHRFILTEMSDKFNFT